jgi:hypothetical protein
VLPQWQLPLIGTISSFRMITTSEAVTSACCQRAVSSQRPASAGLNAAGGDLAPAWIVRR